MQLLFLKFHQKFGYPSDFFTDSSFFFSPYSFKENDYGLPLTTEKLECTESSFLSTKDHPYAAEILKSLQLAFPVTSQVIAYRKSRSINVFTVCSLVYCSEVVWGFISDVSLLRRSSYVEGYVWDFLNFHLRKQLLKPKSSILIPLSVGDACAWGKSLLLLNSCWQQRAEMSYLS